MSERAPTGSDLLDFKRRGYGESHEIADGSIHQSHLAANIRAKRYCRGLSGIFWLAYQMDRGLRCGSAKGESLRAPASAVPAGATPCAAQVCSMIASAVMGRRCSCGAGMSSYSSDRAEAWCIAGSPGLIDAGTVALLVASCWPLTLLLRS